MASQAVINSITEGDIVNMERVSEVSAVGLRPTLLRVDEAHTEHVLSRLLNSGIRLVTTAEPCWLCYAGYGGGLGHDGAAVDPVCRDGGGPREADRGRCCIQE